MTDSSGVLEPAGLNGKALTEDLSIVSSKDGSSISTKSVTINSITTVFNNEKTIVSDIPGFDYNIGKVGTSKPCTYAKVLKELHYTFYMNSKFT